MSRIRSGLVLWGSLCLAACAGKSDHPPVLDEEGSCEDAGCHYVPPPTSGGDAGMGAICIPKAGAKARVNPILGVVVELDDFTFALNPDATYRNTRALTHRVSVEALAPGGCTLVKTTPKADGSFSLSGAIEQGYLRIRPVDEPELITTMFLAPSSGKYPLPIVTRNAIDGAYSLTRSRFSPDPEAAQIVVSFVTGPDRIALSGRTFSGPDGTLAYDGAGASGAYGLGMAQNVTALDYPGDPVHVESVWAPRPALLWEAVVARDSVTLLAAFFQ